VRSEKGWEWGFTFVVEHDCEDRDLVALCDPVHTPWHTEQESAITNYLTDELALVSSAGLHVAGELDTQSSAARPAQAAAAAVDPGARDCGLDLVCDESGLCDGFDGPERILWNRLADFRHEV
jgi:hypothetical protein